MANQIRGFAAEQGIIFPVGIKVLQKRLAEALEDAGNNLTYLLRRLLTSLMEHIRLLNEHIEQLDKEIVTLCQQQPSYSRLCKIPGVGPLTAAALLSEV